MKKLIFNLIGVAGIVLGAVNIFSFIEGDMIDMTPLFIAIVGFLVAFIFFRIAKKNGRTHCPKCGYKYDYENDVAHHVNKNWDDGKKAYVLLDFECECRKCGHEIKFKEKYVTQEVRNGRVVEHDVLGQIRRYFK